MRKGPISFVVAVCFGLVGASAAAAQEQTFRLYGEPTSYTDVADAFDSHDAFDLNLSLQYDRQFGTGRIQRERGPGLPTESGRASITYDDIADFQRTRNLLTVGLEIGIFHDISLFARLPIVLSDSRQLSALDGDPSDPNSLAGRSQLRRTEDQPTGAPIRLFEVPFRSPDRSGIDHLELGLTWAIFNQFRSPSFPTWLISIEGRFALGEEMHACEEGGSVCLGGGTDPGVSDGTHWIRATTRSSYRLRYVEPYAGLHFTAGFPGQAAEDFRPGGALAGFTNTIPPLQGEFVAGVAIIPWEQRVRAQRVVIDARFIGAYFSEGHYYTPLFDALGTSDSAYLTSLNSEGYNPTTGVGTGRMVAFTGLTDTQSRGRVTGRLAIELQAAEYIRFVVGGAVGYENGYTITFADACNPNQSPSDAMDTRRGTCRSGIINPHHRPNIDLPGRRFRVENELLLDFFVSAIGQF